MDLLLVAFVVALVLFAFKTGKTQAEKLSGATFVVASTILGVLLLH